MRCGPKWTHSSLASQGFASQNGELPQQGVRRLGMILAGKVLATSCVMGIFPSSQVYHGEFGGDCLVLFPRRKHRRNVSWSNLFFPAKKPKMTAGRWWRRARGLKNHFPPNFFWIPFGQKLWLINLKPGIWCFGGSKKRTKFRKKNLLGPFLIMGINRLVFVCLILLFVLFSPDNAVSQIQVWSDVWPPRQNSTYLLFVLISTLANVTTPGCERGTESECKDPSYLFYACQHILSLSAYFMLVSTFDACQFFSCLSATVIARLMLVKVCRKLKIELTQNDLLFQSGLSGWSFFFALFRQKAYAWF